MRRARPAFIRCTSSFQLRALKPSRKRAASSKSTDASDATSPYGPIQRQPNSPTRFLYELLMAQTAWLATHAPATVRRRLIAALALLG